jgi:UDP:flavonoid glycosyltransferase YjiC (YdhE family)
VTDRTTRFVLCSTPAQGHTAPLLALAERLVHDGHGVVFFTTEHYRERVMATGAGFVPFDPAYDAHDLMVANPDRESRSGAARASTCAWASPRRPWSPARCGGC